VKNIQNFLPILVLSLALPLVASSKNPKAFLPKSFSSEFKQIHISSLTGKEKVSWGTIEYLYPSKLRFEVNKPNKIIFVSNPRKSWYYTAPFIEGEPGELTIKPTGKMVLSRFFDMLAHGFKSNKQYTVKPHESGKRLIFTEKASREIGLREALLKFKKGHAMSFSNLIGVELTYLEKKQVTIVLQNLKTNVTYKKNKFIFDPPPNTRIGR